MFLVIEWLCALPQDWPSTIADHLAVHRADWPSADSRSTRTFVWTCGHPDASRRHLSDVDFPKDVQNDNSDENILGFFLNVYNLNICLPKL
jgi:hypothetical protein